MKIAAQLASLVDGEISLSEVSRRSGVSRNTLHSWLRGDSQPSLSTLEKVMLAAGKQVRLELDDVSDPHATTAARMVLGERDISPRDDEGVREWTRRFADWGDDSTAAVARRAAWASNPLARKGAAHYAPAKVLTVASAAQATGEPWALSGAYAADKVGLPSDAGSVMPQVSLVWCMDPEAVAARLPQRFRRSMQPVAGGISVVPATGTETTGVRLIGGVNYVSEAQLLIDVLAKGVSYV